MASLTLRALDSAIAQTLGAAAGVARARDATGLADSVIDVPLVQVRWMGLETRSGQSDRLTFAAGVRATEATFAADVYARQQPRRGQDSALALDLADAVQAELEAQRRPPCFGVAGAAALRWQAEPITLSSGGASYAGVRFVLVITLF